MSQTIQSNLAVPSTGTSAPAPARTSLSGIQIATGEQRTHIIDRLTSWLGASSTAAFLLLLFVGRDAVRRAVATGDAWLFVGLGVSLAIVSGAFVFRFLISPLVGNRLRELAEVAESVAAGDLTLQPKAAGEGGQLGRLARAMASMTRELRELAGLLTSTSTDTAQLSAEITQGTEHMAQAAAGIADTAATLSEQASTMAGSIQHLTTDATRLADLARTVKSGAETGIERNARLRTLASENHERLEESARRLEALAVDVREGATTTESLASASGQIREFVSLVQKIARQSKLLALNAAMEAARAGEQGEGFAVVANEVRRLAQTATEAAEHTDALMKDVLGNMETALATSARTLGAVRAVQAATDHGRSSFTQVESAVAEAEGWTSAVAESAHAGNALAREITTRLDSLTAGTQAFASAMHDVAAASEEQSASTQEIAAAVAHLTQAADRVTKAAQLFRT